MDGMAESGERTFGEALGERGMHVDRAGNVFKHGAHFDRQRKLARQLGHMSAHRVNAKHHMVLFARSHPNKTAIFTSLHGQSATRGGHRKPAHNHVLTLGFSLLG